MVPTALVRAGLTRNVRRWSQYAYNCLPPVRPHLLPLTLPLPLPLPPGCCILEQGHQRPGQAAVSGVLSTCPCSELLRAGRLRGGQGRQRS